MTRLRKISPTTSEAGLLLDTGVFLRLATTPERLPMGFVDAIDRAERKYLSAASIWEIAIKSSIGKLPLPTPVSEYVPKRMEQFGLRVLSIAREHAAAVETLPFHHRDPFDRLLVAQAQIEGLSIVTTDRIFEKYAVHVLGMR